MSLPAEAALELKTGLPPSEVYRRLVALARVHRRVESVLCFYLQEVENRRLYLKYGFASTVDYAPREARLRGSQDALPRQDGGAFRRATSVEKSLPAGRHSLDEGARSPQGGDTEDRSQMAGSLQEYEQSSARAGSKTQTAANEEADAIFRSRGRFGSRYGSKRERRSNDWRGKP